MRTAKSERLERQREITKRSNVFFIPQAYLSTIHKLFFRRLLYIKTKLTTADIYVILFNNIWQSLVNAHD